jgi:hypothetical protein
MIRRQRAWVLVELRMTVHKVWVAYYLLRYALAGSPPRESCSLMLRAVRHDLSKYRPAEARAFVERVLLPASVSHESAAYQQMLLAFKHQADLHYARNSHHPEHHARGYTGMSELDRIEMVADWAAATRRLGVDGGVREWIAERSERYGYDGGEVAQLEAIAVRMGAT